MWQRADRSPYALNLLGCILISIFILPIVDAQTRFPETIAVLKAAYKGEIQAFHTYLAYAEKANSEKYPNIAKLFIALASSERIHARNFRTLLVDLGVDVSDTQIPQIEVSSTKKNLKRATKVELSEIDTKYPQSINKIESENHEAATRYLTYAWKAEKQHRDLIKKIQSGTGMLFGLLSKKIEGTPTQYFVCQNCGSTLTELPKEACPICQVSVSRYKALKAAH
ncbi:MAG: rubrerythrin [Desulfobacteraceae bacterium]|nr:rubrerythrin [Desulfobacteraceae bacterium]